MQRNGLCTAEAFLQGGEGPALQRLEKAVRPSAECRKETVPTEEAGEASKGKITRTGPLRPY